ncbi:hypothetical protein [Microlunatus antarcticus]|uniref:Uncharacterized protein n=1 Tax=Microlunatus antarcticus TaxID=53388 RepID=A0A7W5JU68_9ACTN|nr:hypothetical protein [Microlunatus antarcticus]MBB3326369.1 hypothetical protein [Microlunatus antarcticus]
MSDETTPEIVGRRGLLGRGAALAAGTAAGALALGAGTRPAEAAAGDPLIIGSGANLTARYTQLEYRTTGEEPPNRPTLGLINAKGPALYLEPSPEDTDFESEVGYRTEAGSFFTLKERPVYRADEPGNPNGYAVGLATLDDIDLVQQPYITAPYRILDTTKAFPGTIQPTTNFDSSGRLKAGRYVDVAVGTIDRFTIRAVFVNVHSSGSTANGYLAVYPAGTSAPSNIPPRQSTVHFTKGVTVANFTVTPAVLLDTAEGGPTYFIRVYASATTHVVVDLLGQIRDGVVSDPNSGVPSPLQHRTRRPRSAARRITSKLKSPR